MPQEFIKQANLKLLKVASIAKSTQDQFQAVVDQIKEYNYIVIHQITNIKGLDKKLNKLQFSVSNEDEDDKEQLEIQLLTNKWNPLTFAIYNGNLQLIKYILQMSIGRTKKMIKVPGISNNQEINQLFPFFIALQQQNTQLFKYFWEELNYLWDEFTFDMVFKLLAKRELEEYIQLLFKSRTSHTIFGNMSYYYQFSFIQNIIKTKHDFIEEINQKIREEIGEEDQLLQKKESLNHFFLQIYRELSLQPYSLIFFICFSKDLIINSDSIVDNEECLDILRNSLKNSKDSDIEYFLHYKTDIALQIVIDMIDEPNQKLVNHNSYQFQILNAIDKENKNFATRLKKAANFKIYKQIQFLGKYQ